MVGGKSDSSVISLVKESRLLTFSELNEDELELTWSSLDQELDNILCCLILVPVSTPRKITKRQTKEKRNVNSQG